MFERSFLMLLKLRTEVTLPYGRLPATTHFKLLNVPSSGVLFGWSERNIWYYLTTFIYSDIYQLLFEGIWKTLPFEETFQTRINIKNTFSRVNVARGMLKDPLHMQQEKYVNSSENLRRASASIPNPFGATVTERNGTWGHHSRSTDLVSSGTTFEPMCSPI